MKDFNRGQYLQVFGDEIFQKFRIKSKSLLSFDNPILLLVMNLSCMVVGLLLICLTHSWCLKTTVNLTVEVSKLDYSPDGAFIAVTSISANQVYIYETINFFRVFTYTPSGGNNVRTARFSRDGLYLGIGFDDGDVRLVPGQPPFSNSANRTISTQSQNIVDIDFNYGFDKLLVCYNDDSDFYVVKNYASASPSQDDKSASDDHEGCKWSKADDAVIIDDDQRCSIFPVQQDGTIDNRYTRSSQVNTDFNDLAVRPINSTPIKVVLAGGINNDIGAAYLSNSGGGSVATTTITFNNNPTDKVNAACYAPDASVYVLAGKEKRIWFFNDSNNSEALVINGSTLEFKNCMFSPDGETLALGTIASGGAGYVQIYVKTCYFCAPGYYGNSLTGCSACSTAMEACSLCYNSTYCTSCFQGYYYNVTSRACVPCATKIEGCSTCNSSTVCYECNPGFYLASNACTSCLSLFPGCIACNGTSCQLCGLDYFKTGGGNCSLCSITNCLRCTASNVCIACAQGFFVAAAGGASCTACNSICAACYNTAVNCSSCIRGYYLNVNTCTACSSNCLSCANNSICSHCREGYYIDNSTGCSACLTPCATCTNSNSSCLSCTVGYYLLGTSCEPCDKNCSLCFNATKCFGCNMGFYLTSLETCESCNSQFTGCQICSLGICLSCFSSRYLATTTSCLVCDNAMAGCQVCTNSTGCDLCAIGYYHTGATGASSCALCPAECLTCISNTSCSQCAVGYWLNSTSCSLCAYPCASCSSANNCLSCVLGHYLNGTTCSNCTAIDHCLDCLYDTYCIVCSQGFYPNSGSCSVCPSNCLQCNSTNCQACDLGFYLSAALVCSPCHGNCSLCSAANVCQSCNVGYFFNSSLGSNQCQKCALVGSGCITCNSSTCYSCSQGFFLNTGSCDLCSSSVDFCELCMNGSACTLCYDGYYLAAPNSCLDCSSLAGCLDCVSALNCTICSAGFYLDTGVCYPCPANCTVCSTATSCSICSISYYLSGSSCPSCQDSLSGCEQCSSNASCLVCNGGYLLVSSLCEPCSNTLPACSLCNASGHCQSCQQGYFLNSTYECQLCSSSSALDGCLLCNSSSVCQYCINGYYLSIGTCSLCSSAIQGCQQCSSNSTCSDCASGYYLNFTSSICLLCSSNISGCIFCLSNSTCTQCQGGYYLSAGVCYPCSSTDCEICNATSPSNCITCNTGYFLSGSICTTCSQGCLVCNSTACLDCESSYYLSSGSCLLCSSAINGCSKCSSDTVCNECQSLFFLSSNTCLICNSIMVGCSFCTNTSVCLSCDGGYYINGTQCSPCSDLTGCLICNSSSYCLACNAGYYSSGTSCLSCNSSIPNCYKCFNSTLCAACESGYQLSPTASGCSILQLTSGTAQPTSVSAELSFRSYYINSTTLKHALAVKDKSAVFQNINSRNWSSVASISLENAASKDLLTIWSVELSLDGFTLYFYTNNPLNIVSKQMPVTNAGRILIGQSMTDVNLLTSFSLPKSVMNDILPSVLLSSDLVISYDLNKSQFYTTFIKQTSELKYYLFGMGLIVVLFLYGFCRATCFQLYSRNIQIAGHILALKTMSVVVYPTYAEYVNFCLGFMAADFPWLNSQLPQTFYSTYDVMPFGYHFFFVNMNFAAMSLISLLIFLLFLILSYCLLASNKADQIRIKEKKDKQSSRNYRFAAFRQFLMNFFWFGFVFAGFSSLLGAFLNRSSILTLNGFFYISGIIVFSICFGKTVSSLIKNKSFNRFRVAIKAILLAAAGLNPVYLSAVAIVGDFILIVVEYNLRKKTLSCPKSWLLQNISLNSSLFSFYFIPDSFLTLGITVTFLVIGLVAEVYQYCCESKEVNKQMQLFEDQQNITTTGYLWGLNKIDKINSSNELDNKIHEKQVVNKQQSFIFNLQETGGENKEAMTTGYSNSSLEPRRRTRKFKQERTNASTWSKAKTQDIPEIFLEED